MLWTATYYSQKSSYLDSTELNLLSMLSYVWDDSFHWRDEVTYVQAIYKPPFRSRMSSVYVPCLPSIHIVITNVSQDTIQYTEKKAEKKNKSNKLN